MTVNWRWWLTVNWRWLTVSCPKLLGLILVTGKGEHNIFHPAVAFGVSCTNFASKRWSKFQFMSSPLARFHWIDVEVDVPKGFTKFAEWTTQQWFYSKITGHKCHDYGFATNIYLNFEKFIVRIFPGNYLLTASYTLLELQEG